MTTSHPFPRLAPVRIQSALEGNKISLLDTWNHLGRKRRSQERDPDFVCLFHMIWRGVWWEESPNAPIKHIQVFYLGPLFFRIGGRWTEQDPCTCLAFFKRSACT